MRLEVAVCAESLLLGCSKESGASVGKAGLEDGASLGRLVGTREGSGVRVMVGWEVGHRALSPATIALSATDTETLHPHEASHASETDAADEANSEESASRYA